MIKDYVVFNLKQHVCVHKTSIKRNNDIFRVLKAKTITLVVTKKRAIYKHKSKELPFVMFKKLTIRFVGGKELKHKVLNILFINTQVS